MKIKVVYCVSILSSILLATGLVVVGSYSNHGIEQAYSLLPGIPSSESPFSNYIDIITENNARYPSDYEVSSTNPYIIQIDYTNHSKISQSQARRISLDFLKAVLAPEVFDILSYGPSYHSGLLPEWSFEFLNSTQDPHTQVVAFVDVNSISGGITTYIGPLPDSVLLNTTDSNGIEVAKAALEIFNTSIPSNSRYEQLSSGDSKFIFMFTQVVGPVVIHDSVGSIYLEIETNTTYGDRCFYSVSWIPFSEIPTERVMNPYSLENHTPRSLMLIPTPYDDFDYENQDYRLCWWLSNSIFSEHHDTIIDAYSGEIVQYIYYHFDTDPFTPILTPLLIPISAVVFASISFLIVRRRIVK